MNPKVDRNLQRLLEELGDDEFLTVVVKARDTSGLTEYLDMIKRQNVSLSYRVAPLFAVVVLSASKKTIGQVADREEVVAVMDNREFTVPPVR